MLSSSYNYIQYVPTTSTPTTARKPLDKTGKTLKPLTDKNGVETHRWTGRQKRDPRAANAALGLRGADGQRDNSGAAFSWFLAARPFPRTTAKIAKARAKSRAEKADARVRSYLNADPTDLSDRELYAARDHVREICAQLDRAATEAETPKEAKAALKLGEKMRQRGDLIQDELKTRPAPITRALRLLQGKDVATGRYVKKDKTRKANDGDDGEIFSGFEDKVGGWLTGWFDFFADTLSRIRKS